MIILDIEATHLSWLRTHTLCELPTNNSNHKLSRGLINTCEQRVVHDGVLGQELRVSINGLHQYTLGVGVHIHWAAVDVCMRGGSMTRITD